MTVEGWNIGKRRCLGIMIALVLGMGMPAGMRAEPQDAAKNLETSLRQLEKEIAAVRGLQFKAPVAAKVIPRPKDATRKVQGYYSLKDKTFFIYDDVSGAYERGVLIHEMVHALQDQHFGLSKLHETSFGSDAELARAALIEGDATWTMIEMLQKDQPRVTAMLETSLDKARDVQTAFLYAQGARYVKALKERGGWAAVNSAYRFPPRSTAAILHPEGVSTINLGPGTVRGELGIIKLLASQAQTAPLALQAAAGWKGDRTTESDRGRAWVVAFATRDDVQQFHQAMTKYHGASQPDLKPIRSEAAAAVWQGPKGNIVAVLARDDRVHVLEAPDQTAYRALLDRIEGPPALLVHSARDKRGVSFGDMIERLLEADLICVGETHDSELHHRLQLQIIKAIHAHDERLGIGMEMFQRPFQASLDRYVKGEIAEEEFLKATEYRQRWGYDWGLYKPIVEFGRRNGLPLAALNVPRELTSRVSKAGHAGLTDDEKKQLGEIDFQVKAHRDYWYERLAKLHGQAKVTEEQKERSYQVMTIWDEYMGASAAQFQQGRHLRRLVVLAGSGHIDHGLGIPARAAKRTGGKVATVHIAVGVEPEKAIAEAAADFIVIVKSP